MRDGLHLLRPARARRRCADALRRFDGGRLVVNVVDMPIKCPVAPLEFASSPTGTSATAASATDVELTYVTPLDGAFTKPVASERAGRPAGGEGHRAGHRVHSRRGRRRRRPAASATTSARCRSTCWSSSRCTAAPAFVGRSPGLGDELGFVPTDPHTLQAKAAPNIFAIGDATNLPTSKAGSVTHFEGEVADREHRPLPRRRAAGRRFDGHANCFIETGFGKALLIDFNYDTEPLPGHFPAGASACRCCKESHLNHLGKLMFQWFYWHGLLPGRDIPGIGPAMPRRQAPSTHRTTTGGLTMTTATIAGTVVERRRRGFLADPGQWTEEMAAEIARANGIDEPHRPALAGHQLHAQRLPREGTGPTVRALGKASGVPVKELYQLFPKGPAKLAAKIAGIPKPRGCI